MLTSSIDSFAVDALDNFYGIHNDSLLLLILAISIDLEISDHAANNVNSYHFTPQNIGPAPKSSNPLPSLESLSGAKLKRLLVDLHTQTDNLEILSKSVFSCKYPEFYHLLPYMITSVINLVY